jgi:hypothetical protein
MVNLKKTLEPVRWLFCRNAHLSKKIRLAKFIYEARKIFGLLGWE